MNYINLSFIHFQIILNQAFQIIILLQSAFPGHTKVIKERFMVTLR